MSIQTLYTAATGMEALQTKLDIVANNLANVNTTAFKRDRANFEDNFYRHEVLPGAQDSAGNLTPLGIQIGLGSRVESTQSDFRQGAFQHSSRELDVAIEGDGFFIATNTDGTPVYTRSGNWSTNANGQVVVGSASTGRVIEPAITIPSDATGIVISPEGIVSVSQAGNPALSPVGQLQMALFINPQGLLKLGENLYGETDASGTATQTNPGQNGAGLIRQNALEASNVEPVQELIDLITTQRAFELNAQTVHAGDEMLRIIASLPRP